MKVSVSDVSATQKRLTVEVPAEAVQQELNKKYRELAKRVRIKGFRPGKVPKNILKAYYGKAIDNEVAQEFIEKTFPDVLDKEGIKPLAEADLEDFSYRDDGSLKYSAIVEVAPSFEAKGYKEIELKKGKSREISEDDVERELESIAESSASLETLEDAEVKEGHVVTVDITPYIDGEVVEEYVEEDIYIEVGKDTLYHPDFSKYLLGARIGDTCEFEITYSTSDEAPTEEWVGKTVKFYVDINNIARKELPEINDEFAKNLGFDSLDKLKEEIKGRLEKQIEEEERKYIREQIDAKLLESNDIPIPEKAVLKEIESEIKNIEMQLLRQGINHKFDDPGVRERLKPSAELSIKLRIIMDKIAEQENITLSPEEEEEIYNQLASILKVSADEARSRFEKSSLFDKMKANKIREKVYEFIEKHARFVEASEESKEDASETIEEKKEGNE